MIALAGTLGTGEFENGARRRRRGRLIVFSSSLFSLPGLFLGSGKAIVRSGPAGALMACE